MASISPAPHSRRSSASTDTWITPQWLIDRLGPFDLDPCSAPTMPWPTATHMIDEESDGLLYLWHGCVWMNPPYGVRLGVWLNRLALHRNGIALVFARTDTRAFFQHVWPLADIIVFLRGRITFCSIDGTPAPQGHNSGGPSCLIGYGAEAVRRLELCGDIGRVIHLKKPL